MLPIRFFAPVLAFMAALALTSPASAYVSGSAGGGGGSAGGGGGGSSNSMPRASSAYQAGLQSRPGAPSAGSNALTHSSGGRPTVFRDRSLFGRKETVTTVHADGSTRTESLKRGFWGGRKLEIAHKDASGNTTFEKSETTNRKGEVKELNARGAGWSTASKTKTNFLTGSKKTEFRENDAQGNSASGTRKVDGSGRVVKSDTIEKNAAGDVTKSKERRSFFLDNLKSKSVTRDLYGQKLRTDVVKYRGNETVKKVIGRVPGEKKEVKRYDRKGFLKP